MRTQLLTLLGIGLLMWGVMPLAAQSPDAGDALMEPFQALIEQGKITPLEMRQTQGDITVTLHWVYLDALQGKVAFTIEGVTQPPMDEPFYFPQVWIHDAAGYRLFTQGIGGYGSDPSALTPSLHFLTTLSTTQFEATSADGQLTMLEDYFATRYGETVPETADLSVLISLQKVTPDRMPVEGEVPLEFEFPVTVPLYPAETYPIRETVEVNDISATLQSIRVTPAQVSAVLCYELPDVSDWQPVPTLTIGDTAAFYIGGGMQLMPAPQDQSRCFDLQFQGSATSELPQPITLTLEKIWVSEPMESLEFWDQVAAELLKQNIEVAFTLDHAMHYEVLSKPQDMSDEAVWEAIVAARSALRPAIEGPWVFLIQPQLMQ